tara:strand:- start:289 stop:507 length:219 start_codon:yes stop_codon:yes gene_type:complete
MWCHLTEHIHLHPLRRLLTILAGATNPIEDEEDHSDIDLYALDEDDELEDDEEYGYERNDDQDEDEEEDEDF